MSTEKSAKFAESQNFEQRVREAFGQKPVTQIARETGISYDKLRNYLNGRSDVPTAVLIKIAEAANCSIDWLLTGKNYRSPGFSVQPEMTNPVIDSAANPLLQALDSRIREIVREEFLVMAGSMETDFYNYIPVPLLAEKANAMEVLDVGTLDDSRADDTDTDSRPSLRRKAG